MTQAGAVSGRLSVSEAQRFLYREARMLDELRLEEWLELFTGEGLYWLPATHADVDPRTSVALIYDDAARRTERVWRTLHTPVLDQNPRSRTVHAVSNVEVEQDSEGEATIHCVQHITELRPGGPGQVGLNDQNVFAARSTYRLRHVQGEWRIALKKVVLINADQPLFNLAFIV